MSIKISARQQTASWLALTGLACDDHGLHDEGEELVQQQVEVEHQGLQAGRGQGHDAQLQLLFQLVLGNLLLLHAQREADSALQGATQREEALQVVVLETWKQIMTFSNESVFFSSLIATRKEARKEGRKEGERKEGKEEK